MQWSPGLEMRVARIRMVAVDREKIGLSQMNIY